MYCPKCGTENPDNAQVCQSCNYGLTSSSTTAPAPATKTSGLAITSLVLGILSILFTVFTGIAAIILGIVALSKIGKSAGHLKGKGLAITGIAVPAAWMLIVVLAILMHVLFSPRMGVTLSQEEEDSGYSVWFSKPLEWKWDFDEHGVCRCDFEQISAGGPVTAVFKGTTRSAIFKGVITAGHERLSAPGLEGVISGEQVVNLTRVAADRGKETVCVTGEFVKTAKPARCRILDAIVGDDNVRLLVEGSVPLSRGVVLFAPRSLIHNESSSRATFTFVLSSGNQVTVPPGSALAISASGDLSCK